ncbi:conserved hypothetical protein [Thermobaculum terrenum ATCC BAA-798]|uniref:NHL repeat containing protein n=1 Tax=Thermobaculum terrenum (strain ATCC BAA-798 / CCMEE 7001 / YNP1) TaxID=525904 RepID=D1CHS9_THET1|nr:ScyD/ScyE family protein [Thermobaculum terrenum]ACZ43300.1 conserved hypothetical protein [Thermobaculum terrenum ATCC BAA-798]
MSYLRYIATWGLACMILMIGVVSPASSAQAATVTIVATGLNNPRHLAFGPDGAIYIAEAGKGGSGPCVNGPEGRTCFGNTGSITKIWHGGQARVVRGLPSAASPDGSFAIGPHDVSAIWSSIQVQDHRALDYFVLIGGGFLRPALGKSGVNFGRLIKIRPDGVRRSKADLWTYEKQHDPAGDGADSNPYSLLTLRGRHIIADAGGNSLLKVRRSDGRISTLATFPKRMVPGPDGQLVRMDPVPTSVDQGPDRAYYVGELTGFPFPKFGARVYRVMYGHEREVYARRFTNIIDVAWGPDNSLYVLEMFKNSLANANPQDPSSLQGRLVRIRPDGSRTTVMSEGLYAPGGVAVAEDGTIYVTNWAILPGKGEVLRIQR